jgi:hypothetical protein
MYINVYMYTYVCHMYVHRYIVWRACSVTFDKKPTSKRGINCRLNLTIATFINPTLQKINNAHKYCHLNVYSLKEIRFNVVIFRHFLINKENDGK